MAFRRVKRAVLAGVVAVTAVALTDNPVKEFVLDTLDAPSGTPAPTTTPGGSPGSTTTTAVPYFVMDGPPIVLPPNPEPGEIRTIKVVQSEDGTSCSFLDMDTGQRPLFIREGTQVKFVADVNGVGIAPLTEDNMLTSLDTYNLITDDPLGTVIKVRSQLAAPAYQCGTANGIQTALENWRRTGVQDSPDSDAKVQIILITTADQLASVGLLEKGNLAAFNGKLEDLLALAAKSAETNIGFPNQSGTLPTVPPPTR